MSQNVEEAATIASEFVSSLDHLPSEINHILQEIKVKETRSQELQQEIARDCNKYTRHALRHSTPTTPSAPVTPSEAVSPSLKNGYVPLTAPPKDQALLPKIEANYAEVDRLAVEKIALAQRVLTLLTRTRARLDVELAKVSVLQGDVLSDGGVLGGSLSAGAGPNYLNGASPMAQISDSLKLALSPSAGGSDVSVHGFGHKKRRLASGSSLKLHTGHSPLPSATPPAATAPTSTPYSRSRLSKQLHPKTNKRAAAMVQEDEDMDAEGEDDDEASGEDAEDRGLYCFCQQMSHGEMVACDNPDCPYQWFHFDCLNVEAPLPEHWFCSDCEKKGFGVLGDAATPTGTGRKGRRK